MSIRFINLSLTKYPIAMLEMDIALDQVKNGGEECVLITEHNALYSAGKSFELKDFITKPHFPVYFPKRGGRVTVHSPGQLVIYPIVNLKKRNLNVSSYVELLEFWIIDVLAKFGIKGELSSKGIGIWIENAKVGFIGIRIEHGITSHGLCLNISNDLTMFNSIIPCGIDGLSITSLEKAKNERIEMQRVIEAFIAATPF